MPASPSQRARLASLALVGAAASAAAAGWLVSRGGPDALLWAGLATQGLWIGLAVGLAAWLSDEPLASRLGLGRMRLRGGSLAVLVVGMAALSQGLSLLLTAVELRDTGTLRQIDGLVSQSVGPSFALALLALGIAPGIAEELLFRGLIQRGLVRRLGAGLGVALAALAFGIAHADPVHGPAAGLLGVYLGVTAWIAGSTRASMLCHVANNLLGLLVPRVPVPENGPAPPVIGFVLVLVALVLLVAVARAERRRRPAEEAPPGAMERAEPAAEAAEEASGSARQPEA